MNVYERRNRRPVKEESKMFRTFTRTWWKENKSWPNGLEPEAGTAHYHGRYENEKDARAACKQWNDTHDPGRLSIKMEYEEC